jgi:hypothetical protein
LQSLVIGLAMAAAAIAVLPIIFAVAGGGGAVPRPRTAFASAPSGQYAVVSRTEGDTDVIAVVPSWDPANATEIARVRHLNGFSTIGAVAPGGAQVALVTPDGGTSAQPTASITLVDLESGEQSRLASGFDAQAAPLWTPDGGAIVAARVTAAAGGGVSTVKFVRLTPGGSEAPLRMFTNVLGAYAVGFDANGGFVAVVIDQRGSTLYRDGSVIAALSTQITRDWRLSPDGTQVAFIEANLDGGLHYVARTVPLDGAATAAAVSAQELDTGAQQLGVAWKPGAATPTFGSDRASAPQALSAAAVPAAATADGVTGGAGFDVPMAYSADGSVLAVTHWTGASFADAGRPSLEVVSADGSHAAIAGFGGFVGWAAH